MKENAKPIIFDGHNDTLIKVCSPGKEKGRPFLTESNEGHLDIPRAAKGGFAGGIFAICPPWKKKPDNKHRKIPGPDSRVALPPIEHSGALEFTLEVLRNFRQLAKQADGVFKLVRDHEELAKCFDQNVLAVVLHFEGAEAIDPKLNNLDDFYERGLRSLGLVWSRPNEFGYGVEIAHSCSPDTGPGLRKPGFELVKACNDMGILIDLSHINAKGFWDVAKTSRGPLVASHSCAFGLSPSTRNLTGDQIMAIGDSGGIIGMNFHVGFLKSLDEDDGDVTSDHIIRHVDYIVDKIGIDHVGFGSDFDGATMPPDLGDVTGLPALVDKFRQHGYGEDSLNKLTHGNWLRVIRATWR